MGRPLFMSGIKEIDNKSVKNIMKTISELSKRHYVLAEAKANLLAREREDIIGRFSAPHFKLVAHVAVGEPTAEHKDWVHQRILADYNDKKQQLEEEDEGVTEESVNGDLSEKKDSKTKKGKGVR